MKELPQLESNQQDPLNPKFPTSPGDKRRWSGLHGSALSLSIANAAQLHDNFTIVITQDTATASVIEEELRFFSKESTNDDLPILHLPDWETLPYDYFSPHQDIISDRLHTLYQLPQIKRGILVVPVTTLLHRLCPPDYIQKNSLVIEKGQKFELTQITRRLQETGYRCVDTVFEHGEYAVRGSLIDIFPMGSQLPYRIDLFDDEVESLRTFDSETQRTIQQIDSIRLLPAKEYPLDKEGITHFRDSWHTTFDVDHRRCPLYQDVSEGIAPAGIEYYLPLFYEQCGTLFDYIPEHAIVFTQGNLENAIEHFWKESFTRYESRRADIERPILSPSQLFLRADDVYANLKLRSRVEWHGASEDANKTEIFNSSAFPNLAIDDRASNPLHALEHFLLLSENRILFCAESAGRRETLIELLNKIGVKPTSVDSWIDFLYSPESFCITVNPISQGLLLPENKIAIITEGELFGNQIQQRRRRKKAQDTSEQIIKNLTELNVGAPVVHINHGVGRYKGLEIIEVEGQRHEFLLLEYAGNDKLYVPVASLDQISRYSGADAESAPLNKLGSEQWQKAKRKAAEKIRDVAAELLNIYAQRAAKSGYSFRDPKSAYDKFASAFPFEETPDQQTAIESVRSDMLSGQAMDRLVCGDVGFGKTEVAMRAAFIAVQSGKQVAILVPTTLLAQQHYENFKDRFADWPVNVEVLSRFRSTKEVEAVQKKIKSGAVDIIIGTHKLIQPDIKYKSLGLVIIDEEHRFGVRQKDQLKSLRAEVDILTLTATPIPRTLNMSMSGIRDLSIISTPPARRLSVKTFVRAHDNGLVKEAISREILRGGQVYYLHNEVKTIEKTAQDLQELVPEARIAIGHGQLSERELEKVMGDFYHKRFNILVCTTIIETGIDIPNANTIIIDRADKFGLAQLHQLRGRVGRSHHQAYAYLMTPPKKQMTGDAIKRLDAISNTSDLGAGFTLATHDMEIRGAGELLGDGQSGQIQTIGFSLYMEMLDRAVKALQAGKSLDVEPSLADSVEVNLRTPALIPDDYLPDVHSRLIMYKRIAGAKDSHELRELQVEMIDRFGLLPDSTKNLFKVSELKIKALSLGISKLEASAGSGRIEFGSETAADPLVIVKLVQSQPQNYQMSGANHLKFMADMEATEDKFNTIEQLLELLTPKDQSA
ncbi:MAG: transcription-repair coupling factor [Cellvibrionaceae bacterium]